MSRERAADRLNLPAVEYFELDFETLLIGRELNSRFPALTYGSLFWLSAGLQRQQSGISYIMLHFEGAKAFRDDL